jgi:hypothetical protein
MYLDASAQASLRNNEVNSIHLMYSTPRDALQLHQDVIIVICSRPPLVSRWQGPRAIRFPISGFNCLR